MNRYIQKETSPILSKVMHLTPQCPLAWLLCLSSPRFLPKQYDNDFNLPDCILRSARSAAGFYPIPANCSHQNQIKKGRSTCNMNMSDYICGAIKLNNGPSGRIKPACFLDGFWFMKPLKHIHRLLRRSRSPGYEPMV